MSHDHLNLPVKPISETFLRKQEEKLNKSPADSKLRYLLDLPAILPHELDLVRSLDSPTNTLSESQHVNHL